MKSWFSNIYETLVCPLKFIKHRLQLWLLKVRQITSLVSGIFLMNQTWFSDHNWSIYLVKICGCTCGKHYSCKYILQCSTNYFLNFCIFPTCIFVRISGKPYTGEMWRGRRREREVLREREGDIESQREREKIEIGGGRGEVWKSW